MLENDMEEEGIDTLVTYPTKAWTTLSNTEEVLVKLPSDLKKNPISETASDSKVQILKINVNDLVYYSDHWHTVNVITNDIVTLKGIDKSIEAPLLQCKKQIRVHVLIGSNNSLMFHALLVNGADNLKMLQIKLSTKFSIKSERSKWYYAGKQRGLNESIETIGIKPNEKISCFLIGYDIHTFKRFVEIESGRTWYMDHSSPDAITFVPSKAINLFGFGIKRN